LEVEVEGRLPEQVEMATYFADAEALTNTAKHAQVTADAGDAVLRIRVSDDDRGGADHGGGSGLSGSRTGRRRWRPFLGADRARRTPTDPPRIVRG
jgi:signal transduction histidine kinase